MRVQVHKASGLPPLFQPSPPSPANSGAAVTHLYCHISVLNYVAHASSFNLIAAVYYR